MWRKINLFLDKIIICVGIFLLCFVIPIGGKYPKLQNDINILVDILIGIVFLMVFTEMFELIAAKKEKTKIRRTLKITKENTAKFLNDMFLIWGILILCVFPLIGEKCIAAKPDILKFLYIYILLLVVWMLVYKYMKFRDKK